MDGTQNILMGTEQNIVLFLKLQVKVQLPLRLTKHQAMKTCWGSGGIAARVL